MGANAYFLNDLGGHNNSIKFPYVHIGPSLLTRNFAVSFYMRGILK